MNLQFSFVAERILLTLWVGGMWITGYMVAPTLFAVLEDRALAGMLAGKMFTSMSYIALLCGGLLLFGQLMRAMPQRFRQWRVGLLMVMLLIVVVGEFVLQPMMADLKATGLMEGSDAARQFGMLHGVASVLFMINSLAGLALVAFGLDDKSSLEIG